MDGRAKHQPEWHVLLHQTCSAIDERNKFGRIVNIASFVGQAGAFGQANYAASKGAIIAFTKAVALETAQFNITANVIAPGYTATDMVAGMPAQVLEEIASR